MPRQCFAIPYDPADHDPAPDLLGLGITQFEGRIADMILLGFTGLEESMVARLNFKAVIYPFEINEGGPWAFLVPDDGVVANWVKGLQGRHGVDCHPFRIAVIDAEQSSLAEIGRLMQPIDL